MTNARPREMGTGAVVFVPGRRDHSTAAPDPLAAVSRLPWAARLIAAAGGPVPDYGSPAWTALSDQDPRKVAACVVAAEAWRTYTDPSEVARRLWLELEAARAIDDEPGSWTPKVVAGVHEVAGRLTAGTQYAELCERRGEPERAARAREHVARMNEVA